MSANLRNRKLGGARQALNREHGDEMRALEQELKAEAMAMKHRYRHTELIGAIVESESGTDATLRQRIVLEGPSVTREEGRRKHHPAHAEGRLDRRMERSGKLKQEKRNATQLGLFDPGQAATARLEGPENLEDVAGTNVVATKPKKKAKQRAVKSSDAKKDETPEAKPQAWTVRNRPKPRRGA
jgi:hypothetical protein